MDRGYLVFKIFFSRGNLCWRLNSAYRLFAKNLWMRGSGFRRKTFFKSFAWI